MNYIKKTDNYDIYIEPSRKTIVIRQKWKYIWSSASGLPNWSYLEKKEWHQKADNVIWQQWGSQFVFWALVHDENSSSRSLHKKEFNLEFDIEWVTSDQHWLANVKKTKSAEKFRSRVNLTEKKIYLAHIDTKRRVSGAINQNTVKHEFGHTIGVDDEYGNAYKREEDRTKYEPIHVKDTKALMNIGNELRTRYIRDIKMEVNSMIPEVSFITFFK
ncbi:hypothetical protein [Psychroserpens sp. NJDZ02]|uniref:hypothetical protein n=1 Tax=Psychroserpens sp. NJDZ02 TaxID=2570561 RepID=UPI0010A7CA99|nr:hypothetical protein [Psychroserpens sp. NJDZ02]QCE43109.1 hypothetical protein E9099_17350 [Psychroserpens sp. NJDZ02]